MTIRGGRLVVDGSFIVADTQGDVPGARRGIDIAVAQDMRLMHGSLLTTDVFGAGNGGDIHVTAASLTLTDGAQIFSNTTGPGQGGDVTIESARVTLNASTIDSSKSSSGPAGTIRITAKESMTISNHSVVASAASDTATGTAGRIVLSTPRLIDGARNDLYSHYWKRPCGRRTGACTDLGATGRG